MLRGAPTQDARNADGIVLWKADRMAGSSRPCRWRIRFCVG